MFFYGCYRTVSTHGCRKRHLRDYTEGWTILLTFDYGWFPSNRGGFTFNSTPIHGVELKPESNDINLSGLRSLDSLGLAHNQLREVPAQVFSHLTFLNSLELEGNLIQRIDEKAFAGLEGKTATLREPTPKSPVTSVT